MDMEYILSVAVLDFEEKYSNFKDFSTSGEYRPLWNLCIDTIRCEDYIKNIRFCNDYYHIPPVRVFLDINKDKINAIAASDHCEDLFTRSDGRYLMNNFVKQSLGAFWGMVFRFGLHYNNRKTVTMIKNRYYGIATASRFEYQKPE